MMQRQTNIMVLLTTFSLVMGNPISPEPLEDLPLHEEEVQEVLNYIAATGIAMKFPDVPTSLAKLPSSHLVRCVSPMQRIVLGTCIHETDATISLIDRTPGLIECMLEAGSSYDRVKKTISRQNLKSSFIGMAVLSDKQKKSAMENVDACLSSSVYLPPELKHSPIAGKAMVCASKALAINGCDEALDNGLARMNRELVLTKDAINGQLN